MYLSSAQSFAQRGPSPSGPSPWLGSFRRLPTRGLRGLAVLGLVSLVLGGCGDRGSPANDGRFLHVVDRLLDESPELFTPDNINTFVTTYDDRFDRAATVERWTFQGFEQHRLLANLRRELLLVTSGVGEIERRIDVEASNIDRLEVLLVGLPKEVKLEMAWAGPGQDYAAERTLHTKARRHHQPPAFRYELAHESAWSGRIERLRFRYEAEAHHEARLRRISGVDRQTDTNTYDRVFGRSWKFKLRSDTRTGRLVSQERPIEVEVDVPSGAVLEGAFGVHRFKGPDVRFRVEVVEEGSPREIFEGVVGEDRTEKPMAWHPARVDLSSWGGQRVTLRFSADGGEGALAVWGELKLLATAEMDAERSAALGLPETLRPTDDVIVVVIDTLRSDRLSLYGYEQATSPRLEAWAQRKAAVFKTAVTSAPWTFPSHVSLFTGLDTLSHGFNTASQLPASAEMLAEVLQGAGYETLAVTAGGFISPRYGFAQGFDRYFTNTRGNSVAEGDLPVNIRQALDWFGEGDRPRFLFFHTFEVHSPYHARQPYYRELFGDDGDPDLLANLEVLRSETGTVAGAVVRQTWALDQGDGPQPLDAEQRRSVSRAYDSGIAYTDALLGDFFDQLEERGRPTVWAITSDHGEAMGEQDGLGDHGYLFDFNLLVPLVVALPGGEGAGAMIDRQVRLVDIFPTVLASLGLAERPAIDGRSLLPLLDDPKADFPRLAWSSTMTQGVSMRRDGRSKYIANPTIFGRETSPEALFDLRQDPGETTNLVTSQTPDSYSKALVEHYHRTLRGLLVAVESTDAPTVERIEVRAPRAHLVPQQVRTFDAPHGSVQTSVPGTFDIQVVPATRYSVAIEAVSREVPFELILHGEVSCTVAVAELLDASEGSTSVLRLGADCAPLSVGETDDLVLTLLFSGSADDLASGIQELSPELERQLEALGYLD